MVTALSAGRGNGNFGSPGNDPAAAMRYTECKLDPLAMEMLRDIDEDTVDLQDNYDGRAKEPTILPSRIPNLLINGSEGIAVGMATKIPPHNLREIGAAVQWCLENPDVDEAPPSKHCWSSSGSDFPTWADRGQQASRTRIAPGGVDRIRRGEVRGQARRPAGVSELPYQVNRKTWPSYRRLSRGQAPASPPSGRVLRAYGMRMCWCSSATPSRRSC